MKTAYFELSKRVDDLQEVNAELGCKLGEAEVTLQRMLFRHESAQEKMQNKLDEIQTKLAATKGEENEVRSKGVSAYVSDP